MSGIAIKGINLRQTCDEGLISTKIIILHFRSRYYLCFKFSSGQFFQAPEGASGVQSQRLPDGSKTKATPCAYCLPKDDAISVGHASKTGHSRLPKAKKTMNQFYFANYRGITVGVAPNPFKTKHPF